MTVSSVACRSREGARVRDLRASDTTEGRYGSAELPKTDKG